MGQRQKGAFSDAGFGIRVSPLSTPKAALLQKGKAVLDFLSWCLGQKTLVQLLDVPRAGGVSSDGFVLEMYPQQLSWSSEIWRLRCFQCRNVQIGKILGQLTETESKVCPWL